MFPSSLPPCDKSTNECEIDFIVELTKVRFFRGMRQRFWLLGTREQGYDRNGGEGGGGGEWN